MRVVFLDSVSSFCSTFVCASAVALFVCLSRNSTSTLKFVRIFVCRPRCTRRRPIFVKKSAQCPRHSLPPLLAAEKGAPCPLSRLLCPALMVSWRMVLSTTTCRAVASPQANDFRSDPLRKENPTTTKAHCSLPLICVRYVTS